MSTPGDHHQKQLVSRLSRGDEAAFNQLYGLYSKPIYLRLMYLIKDRDVADELLQELFIKLWVNRAGLDAEKSFKSYLYTIAQNLVYNHFRKIASDESLIKILLLKQTANYLDADQILDNKEIGQLLQRAIDQLSPQRRQVFNLCKVEGHSYEEAGRILGISVATVNSHMTKATQLIREYLLKHQHTLVLLVYLHLVHAATGH